MDIAAPAEKVWALVADLPRMGEWSPENAGGTWAKGATGPALGAVFKGTNKNGFRRWSTTVTVIACEPNKVFEFAVTSGPLAVANWRYEFEETDDGCRVTESWVDHRKRWFAAVARLMGDHSAEHAEQEMAATLARLAAAARDPRPRPDRERTAARERICSVPLRSAGDPDDGLGQCDGTGRSEEWRAVLAREGEDAAVGPTEVVAAGDRRHSRRSACSA